MRPEAGHRHYGSEDIIAVAIFRFGHNDASKVTGALILHKTIGRETSGGLFRSTAAISSSSALRFTCSRRIQFSSVNYVSCRSLKERTISESAFALSSA